MNQPKWASMLMWYITVNILTAWLNWMLEIEKGKLVKLLLVFFLYIINSQEQSNRLLDREAWKSPGGVGTEIGIWWAMPSNQWIRHLPAAECNYLASVHSWVGAFLPTNCYYMIFHTVYLWLQKSELISTQQELCDTSLVS